MAVAREARRATREVINRYLKVFDGNDDSFLGYLADITDSGAMVQSHDPIPSGTLYSLRVELPEGLESQAGVVIHARSVWERKERNAVFHNAGFEFENPGADAKHLIDSLIQHYRLEGIPNRK